MSRKISISRVIWSEGGSILLAVAAVVSMACDFGSFLANIALPKFFFMPGAILALIFLVACVRRIIFRNSLGPSQGDLAIYGCVQCNIFRLFFFASIGLGVLVLGSNGSTLTEIIGKKLQLIDESLIEIGGDVSVIRETAAPAEIIRNPSSAEDFFRNAWVFSNLRRDGDSARNVLQKLYERYSPNKIDAAELYAEVGKNYLTSSALEAEMLKLARARKDAAMLVVVARRFSREDAVPLYTEAQTFDPDMPFAYFDVYRADHYSKKMEFGSGALQGKSDEAKKNADALELFLQVASRKPISRYFYIPQHQADFEIMARNMLVDARRYQALYGDLARQARQTETHLRSK